MVIDDIDTNILSLLQQDGRMSHTAIAKLVELSSPAVTSRIQRMERIGLIRGYTALLDPEQIDQSILAFIRVRTGASDDDSRAFEQYVRLAPEVVECHDIDGDDSYILKVRTKSTHTLRDFIVRLRGFTDVSRTITSIVLQTIREEPLTNQLARIAITREATQREAEAIDVP